MILLPIAGNACEHATRRRRHAASDDIMDSLCERAPFFWKVLIVFDDFLVLSFFGTVPVFLSIDQNLIPGFAICLMIIFICSSNHILSKVPRIFDIKARHILLSLHFLKQIHHRKVSSPTTRRVTRSQLVCRPVRSALPCRRDHVGQGRWRFWLRVLVC